MRLHHDKHHGGSGAGRSAALQGHAWAGGPAPDVLADLDVGYRHRRADSPEARWYVAGRQPVAAHDVIATTRRPGRARPRDGRADRE